MSNLLKGEMSRHEHNFSVGSCSETEAHAAAAFLTNEGKQADVTVLPKQTYLDIMDDLWKQE